MSSEALNLGTVTVKIEIDSDSLLACRICLASDVKLFNIQEWGLEQAFAELMGTTLSPCDGLPQYLCTVCRALLVKSGELRTRCRRAEGLLKLSLMHHGYITTSFIQSFNRKEHGLTYTFCHVYSNTDVKHFKHDDTQTNSEIANTDACVSVIGTNIENNINESNADIKHIKLEDTLTNKQTNNDSCAFVINNTIENDAKDFASHANDGDFKIDTDSDVVVHIEVEAGVAKLKNKVNALESKELKIRRKVQSLKTKKVVRNEEKDKLKGLNLKRKKLERNDEKKDTGGGQKSKRKKVVKMKDKDKIEEQNSKEKEVLSNAAEKTKRTKKKKPKRLRLFCTEEHFKQFGDKFNFNVIVLSEEEMVKEMEAKRESDNYKFGVFKCEFCLKGFLSASTYENHMKTHDMARKYECRLCHVRYHIRTHLRLHMERAHELNFHCRQCTEVFKNKYCAELHAAYHAGTTFKCDYCDMTFLKKMSLSSHMRIVHPREIADGGTCEICGEIFVSALGLKAHKRRTHNTQSTLPTLKCRTCKVWFDTAEAIDKHRSGQPGGKCDVTRSACAGCGETCASEQDLVAHRMSRHGLQLFSCDTCGKTFESKDSVGTHIARVHKNIRPKPPARPGFKQRPRARPGSVKTPLSRPRSAKTYEPVCELCGKRVSCMAVLKLHMNKHTGERPFKCERCPKTYTTPVGLNAHEVSHTGVRKYRCQQCPAAYMHQWSLSQHQRTAHEGEKAYQCTICEKKFTQSGSVQTHIKYVHMKVKPPPRKRNKKTAT